MVTLTNLNNARLTPILPEVINRDTPIIMNSSIIQFDGSYYIASRLTNYDLHCSNKSKFLGLTGYVGSYVKRIHSNILIQRYNIDSDNIEHINEIDYKLGNLMYEGVEDPRLIIHNGKLGFIGTKYISNDEAVIELSTLNDKFEVSESIKLPNLYKVEKNWMPIIDESDELHLIHSLSPFTEFVISKDYIATKNVIGPKLFKGFSGGSQFIKLPDETYLGIIHKRKIINSGIGLNDYKYLHYFVMLDKNKNMISISDEFNFMDSKIEFCSGISIHKTDSPELLITFSVADKSAYLLRLPLSNVSNFHFHAYSISD